MSIYILNIYWPRSGCKVLVVTIEGSNIIKSMKVSLKFLRKFKWAREHVEDIYLNMLEKGIDVSNKNFSAKNDRLYDVISAAAGKIESAKVIEKRAFEVRAKVKEIIGNVKFHCTM